MLLSVLVYLERGSGRQAVCWGFVRVLALYLHIRRTHGSPLPHRHLTHRKWEQGHNAEDLLSRMYIHTDYID